MAWGILSLHFLSAGVWSGCAILEQVRDRVLKGSSNELRKAVSALQYWSDLAVQLPAALVVSVTGVKLMIGRSPSKIIHAMSGIGAAALLLKVASLPFVVQRYQAAQVEDWKSFEENEKWARRLTKGSAHTVLLALGLGLYLSKQD